MRSEGTAAAAIARKRARRSPLDWRAGLFEVAARGGVREVAGFTFGGLGVFSMSERNSFVAHLGTGHILADIAGDSSYAMSLAGEIADKGDWDFISFEGWQQVFPEMPQVLADWSDRHPCAVITWQEGDPEAGELDREAARAIASNRP